jgi:hypothetical protein
MIDRIMDQTKGGVKIQFGNWLVMWTGWKAAIDRLELAGQWAAFPIDNETSGLGRSLIYVATPGYWGAMNLGDRINTSWHWPQPTFDVYGRAPSREAGLAALEPYRRISLESLLQLLHNVGSKNGIGQTTDDQVRNAWNSLSPRCQFWLDFDRYIADRYHPGPFQPDRALRESLHRELLGPVGILIKT